MSDLCRVKPYVLRYWEQEFTQLKPIKRRGNRRYYQQHEVLLIRRIRELLYDQGFTIHGARNQLSDAVPGLRHGERAELDDQADALALASLADRSADRIGASNPLSTEPPSAPQPMASAALHSPSERSSACVEALDPARRTAIDPRSVERLTGTRAAPRTV